MEKGTNETAGIECTHPPRYMCYDVASCMCNTPFFCEECLKHHENHQYEDLDSTTEFTKKMKKVTQFQELLRKYQQAINIYFVQTGNKVSKAMAHAKCSILCSISSQKPDEDILQKMESILVSVRNRVHMHDLRIEHCNILRKYIIASNYKELTKGIGNMKKALEKTRQKTYLQHIMVSFLANQTGCNMEKNREKVEEAKTLLKNLASKSETAQENRYRSISTTGTFGLNTTDNTASIIKRLQTLLFPETKRFNDTDEYEANQTSLSSVMCNRVIGVKLEQKKQKTDVPRKIAKKSEKQISQQKNRYIKELQDLKGNFSNYFVDGNVDIKWQALQTIQIYLSSKVLRLSHNNLIDISPLVGVNFKNLKYLHLNNNQIQDLSQLESVDFKSLQVLCLDDNKIKDLSRLSTINFQNIQIVSLNNNLIQELDGLSFVDLKLVQGLALSGNLIQDPSPLKLLTIKELFWIELKNNKFSNEKLEAIRKMTIKNRSGTKICIYT